MSENITGKSLRSIYMPYMGDIFEDNDLSSSSFDDEEESSFDDEEKIFRNETVVQIDMDGNEIMKSSLAAFAHSKEQAKNILGSAKKNGDNELLIADSINKTAFVYDISMRKRIWQYNSDRYITDFALDMYNEIDIEIYDDGFSNDEIIIRKGMTVNWKNKTSNIISIYSGYTNSEIFNANPNLQLYGGKFKKESINVNEEFSFKFDNYGEYYWFVYPSIITGKIIVSSQKISSLDNFYILESDGLETPFSSRAIKVDSWGNIKWSFGEGYIVKPRDIRPMKNGKILIST